jgi:hypothetical protein
MTHMIMMSEQHVFDLDAKEAINCSRQKTTNYRAYDLKSWFELNRTIHFRAVTESR